MPARHHGANRDPAIGPYRMTSQYPAGFVDLSLGPSPGRPRREQWPHPLVPRSFATTSLVRARAIHEADQVLDRHTREGHASTAQKWCRQGLRPATDHAPTPTSCSDRGRGARTTHRTHSPDRRRTRCAAKTRTDPGTHQRQAPTGRGDPANHDRQPAQLPSTGNRSATLTAGGRCRRRRLTSRCQLLSEPLLERPPRATRRTRCPCVPSSPRRAR